MKNVVTLLLFLILPLNAFAETDAGTEKPFSMGVGTYGSVIVYDNALRDDDEFAGLSLSFSYAFSDQFAVRTTLFTQEHNGFSNLDSNGFDLLAYLGAGLATQGLKAYVGGGYFSDEWEDGAFNERFNGLQLSGGVGYNWLALSLDLIMGIRDARDYEDFVNQFSPQDVSAAAFTGSLLLSYRF